MLSEQVNYRLYNVYIRPYLQSLLNIYPIFTTKKQKHHEGIDRQIFRIIHQWHDARNIEIENLPKYCSICQLTHKHWNNLMVTIFDTNPSIIKDFLQHKMAILYPDEYLPNSCLMNERWQTPGKSRS